MAFEQNLSLMFGENKLTQAALDAVRPRAEEARARLASAYHDGSLALLRIAEAREDIAPVLALADKIRAQAEEVVLLGTGGSSLGGQTLAQFGGHFIAGTSPKTMPKITFLDNLDPDSLERHFASPDLGKRHYVAISKSGTTSETLMQLMAAITALRAAGLGEDLAARISGVTEPDAEGRVNGIRQLIGAFGGEILDHDTGVGGRYTCLTNVGLLPAALAGVDVVALRQGAQEMVTSLLSASLLEDCPPLMGAACIQALVESGGASQSVIMAYGDPFQRLTAWYVQLWAESLGKQGLGTTPISALGPVDQHSQLQLFLDGPMDKVFTLISADMAGRGPVMDAGLANQAGAPGLADRCVGDLVSAQVFAVRDALANRSRPLRHIHLPRLDAHHFGALLMHFMLETILSGYLMGIDPLDQPAVEEAKVLTRQYLAKS